MLVIDDQRYFLAYFPECGLDVITWISANDLTHEGSFEWGENSGDSLVYTNWHYTQPENADVAYPHATDDCVSKMVAYYWAKWQDSWCTDLYNYICESN